MSTDPKADAALSERRRAEIETALDLLRESGAGGHPAGLVPSIHNLRGDRDSWRRVAERLEREKQVAVTAATGLRGALVETVTLLEDREVMSVTMMAKVHGLEFSDAFSTRAARAKALRDAALAIPVLAPVG